MRCQQFVILSFLSISQAFLTTCQETASPELVDTPIPAPPTDNPESAPASTADAAAAAQAAKGLEAPQDAERAAAEYPLIEAMVHRALKAALFKTPHFKYFSPHPDYTHKYPIPYPPDERLDTPYPPPRAIAMTNPNQHVPPAPMVPVRHPPTPLPRYYPLSSPPPPLTHTPMTPPRFTSEGGYYSMPISYYPGSYYYPDNGHGRPIFVHSRPYDPYFPQIP